MDAMIRKSILSIFALSWCLMLPAQQMNWARLAEDTIYYAKEYLPEQFLMTFSGPAQTWDFRSLKAPYAISSRIVVSGEREGKTYASLINGQQSEALMLLSGKASQLIEKMDRNPVCGGDKLNYTMIPAYKPFFTGVLGEHYTYRGRMSSVFPWPRNITCAWTPSQLPDSCRVTYTIHEETVVDGEGLLYLPTEVVSALRQKVQIKRATQVEVKYGLTWRDVTTQVPGVRLIVNTELIRFVSSASGLKLVEIEVKDGIRPVSIEFKTHSLITRVFTEEPVRPDIFAYPNPSYDVVRFQLTELVAGKYKLRIYNILGVPVKEVDIEVDESRKTIAVDLNELQRGTYLYRLQDRVGRTIKTKRVVLIQS
jgi:hypothetical protein